MSKPKATSVTETHQRHFDTNQKLWNDKTAVHKDSAFYDLAGFRAGKTSLNTPELELVGDVAGKSLLHLQCHFGLDTLSWSRLGARVTGVDFSDQAIAVARQLNDELGLQAEFVCANVYDLEAHRIRRYDVVFSSYGAICWLPDLEPWAELVAKATKPGGAFVLVEFHPALQTLNYETHAIEYPYFNRGPIEEEVQGTYADPSADLSSPEVFWQHGLSEVTTALLQAGFQLEALREYDYSCYSCFPNMEPVGEGRYRMKGLSDFPHMYGLRMVLTE